MSKPQFLFKSIFLKHIITEVLLNDVYKSVSTIKTFKVKAFEIEISS